MEKTVTSEATSPQQMELTPYQRALQNFAKTMIASKHTGGQVQVNPLEVMIKIECLGIELQGLMDFVKRNTPTSALSGGTDLDDDILRLYEKTRAQLAERTNLLVRL